MLYCDHNLTAGAVISSQSTLSIGAPLVIQCNTSYTLSTPHTVYCESGYKYTDQTMPSCLGNPPNGRSWPWKLLKTLPLISSQLILPSPAKPCEDITIPHGTVSQPIQPGDALKISCEEGYHLDIDTPVTCVAHQIYNIDLPSCVG